MLNLIRLPQAHLSLLLRSPEWQPFLPPSIHTFQLGGTCKLAEDALDSVIDITDKRALLPRQSPGGFLSLPASPRTKPGSSWSSSAQPCSPSAAAQLSPQPPPFPAQNTAQPLADGAPRRHNSSDPPLQPGQQQLGAEQLKAAHSGFGRCAALCVLVFILGQTDCSSLRLPLGDWGRVGYRQQSCDAAGCGSQLPLQDHTCIKTSCCHPLPPSTTPRRTRAAFYPSACWQTGWRQMEQQHSPTIPQRRPRHSAPTEPRCPSTHSPASFFTSYLFPPQRTVQNPYKTLV